MSPVWWPCPAVTLRYRHRRCSRPRAGRSTEVECSQAADSGACLCCLFHGRRGQQLYTVTLLCTFMARVTNRDNKRFGLANYYCKIWTNPLFLPARLCGELRPLLHWKGLLFIARGYWELLKLSCHMDSAIAPKKLLGCSRTNSSAICYKMFKRTEALSRSLTVGWTMNWLLSPILQRWDILYYILLYNLHLSSLYNQKFRYIYCHLTSYHIGYTIQNHVKVT